MAGSPVKVTWPKVSNGGAQKRAMRNISARVAKSDDSPAVFMAKH
jgi:hypothetical protein